MPTSGDHYAAAPEALVISLAAGGDRVAFADLVRRRQPWLRNLMRRLSGDSNLADDLAQSAFLKAWRRIRQLRHPERFGGWMKQIAVREWIDHQRKQGGRWDVAFEDGQHASAPRADAMAVDLDAALASLPEPVRLCIVLSYHEGMSHPEIAELATLPEGTVKSHIRRGSKKLRELLSAYGEAS